MLQPNPRAHPKAVLPYRQRHHHFLQRRIPRPLSDAVDGALDLPHSRADRCQRICHRQPQIIVTVRAQRYPLRIAQMLAHLRKHLAIFFRHRVTHRIRQIQHRRPRVHRHLASLAQEPNIRAPRILGGKLHFRHAVPPVANHRANRFQRLRARHVQLHAQMQIRGRQENVQSRLNRRLQRIHRRIDILLLRARQRRDRHVAHFPRNRTHPFQVATRRNRKSRLNHVHAQLRKLPRQADFFLRVHRKTRRLLAVAQCRIENAYRIHGVCPLPSNADAPPRVKFIFILLLITLSYTSRRGPNPQKPPERSWTWANYRYFLPLPGKVASPARASASIALSRPSAWPSASLSWISASLSSSAAPAPYASPTPAPC